ncbi:hypothetical protein M5X11_20095 [Paenibacillus alginolyticus]|uniref:RCC1 domain-containing protein n=1 Tax=Paenibacillus alginolyticus TaxID=59839 RepID=UPI000684F79A|nr:hypothetical protein [Paenibacillus alginolyticus]MCY9667207.1 hypothetical protein [Paenibacillus alginolyticus]
MLHKRLPALVLSIVLFLSMAPSVKAWDMAASGEYTIVSMGGALTAAIKADDTLWTWGNNKYGGLGDGTTTNRNTPVKVLDHVVSVSAGGGSTSAIKEDGTLWTWGRNDWGQLEDGTTTNRNIPIKVMDNVAIVSAGEFCTFVIRTDGTLWKWGSIGGSSSARKIMDNAVAVSAGKQGAGAAIKEDGTLWTWGFNEYGAVGNDTTTDSLFPVRVLNDVVAAGAGNNCTIAAKSDGTLWVWGTNEGGILGNGGRSNSEHYFKNQSYPIQTIPYQLTDFQTAITTDTTKSTGLTVSIDGKNVKFSDDSAV